MVAWKDLDTGRWVGLYSRGEGTRRVAEDALGQALLNCIQSACPLQNGPVKEEPEAQSGLHQVLVLLLGLSRSCRFSEVTEKGSQMLQTAQVRVQAGRQGPVELQYWIGYHLLGHGEECQTGS